MKIIAVEERIATESFLGHAHMLEVNRDETIDSICSHCFLAIDTSMWEADLEKLEHGHRCEPR